MPSESLKDKFLKEHGSDKLKNPKTKREIQYSTALGNKDHPLYQKAVKVYRQWAAKQEPSEELSERDARIQGQAKKLKVYKHLRKYTDEELENETGEYFENDYAKEVAPNAFKSPKELIKKIKAAKPRVLSDEEYGWLANCDAPDVLTAKNPLAKGRSLAKKYHRDFDRIEKGFTEGQKMPPPILIKDKNSQLYLMAGNTRMMGSAALGHRLPVKVLDYDGVFNFEEEAPPEKKPKTASLRTALIKLAHEDPALRSDLLTVLREP